MFLLGVPASAEFFSDSFAVCGPFRCSPRLSIVGIYTPFALPPSSSFFSLRPPPLSSRQHRFFPLMPVLYEFFVVLSFDLYILYLLHLIPPFVYLIVFSLVVLLFLSSPSTPDSTVYLPVVYRSVCDPCCPPADPSLSI